VRYTMKSCLGLFLPLLLFNNFNFCASDKSFANCGPVFGKVCDGFNDAVDALESVKQIKAGIDTAGKFVDGMIGSFGYVDPSYVYSFKVVNDSSGKIKAARREISKVMGASFEGSIGEHLELQPYTDSGDFYKNIHLNFSVLLQKDEPIELFGKPAVATKTIFEKGVPLTIKNDPNVYYYRAYENRGQLQAEYLGVKTQTTAFSGVFYNSFGKPLKLTFIKDGQTYITTLEPNTFNLLNSTPDNPTSVRPGAGEQRNFTFTDGTTTVKIPITQLGVCNMVLDDKTQKLVPGSPMVYTYEVYSNNGVMAVSSQGLAIGNYTEPVDPKNPNTPVVRDINPVNLEIWYQSIAQASANAGDQAPPLYAIPGQVWALYQNDDSKVAQKLTAGSVQKISVLRPLLSKKQSLLYVVALETTDDNKAQKWIDRLLKGAIGTNVASVSSTASFDPSQAIINQQPVDYGIIDDTQGSGSSGVKGRILLIDPFISQGIGQGPYYYTIQPPILYADQLVGTLAAVIDTKSFSGTSDADIIKQLNQQVATWIKSYGGNGIAGKAAVTSYIQAHGITELFNAGSKVLNLQGQRFIDAFTTGPLSLTQLPLAYQNGVNNFVFYLDKKPDNWPKDA